MREWSPSLQHVVLSTRKGTGFGKSRITSKWAETFRGARYICCEWVGSKKNFSFSQKFFFRPPSLKRLKFLRFHENSSRMAENDQILASRVPKWPHFHTGGVKKGFRSIGKSIWVLWLKTWIWLLLYSRRHSEEASLSIVLKLWWPISAILGMSSIKKI